MKTQLITFIFVSALLATSNSAMADKQVPKQEEQVRITETRLFDEVAYRKELTKSIMETAKNLVRDTFKSSNTYLASN